MDLCRVQFRKSPLEKEQEQAVKAKAKAKTKIMAEADAKAAPDNTPIPYCKFCDLEILFKKNTDGKLIIADARYFFTPIYDVEEWTRHICAYWTILSENKIGGYLNEQRQ